MYPSVQVEVIGNFRELFFLFVPCRVRIFLVSAGLCTPGQQPHELWAHLLPHCTSTGITDACHHIWPFYTGSRDD